MSQIDQIDWSKIPPSHPTCDVHVEVPTLRLQPRAQGYPERPPEFDEQEQKEIVVQWFGDNDRGQLKNRNLQFAFPLLTRPDSVQWFGHPEWYRTVLLGSLKGWPNPEAFAKFLRDGWESDNTVVYVVTSQIGLDDGNGGSRPSALLSRIACLGDGSFGIIRPREYANWAVPREEVAKLARVRQRN